MEKYLAKTQGLESIDVRDVVINMEKYKILDVSNVKEEDVFYTGKFRGPIREHMKSYDYIDKVLSKGNGIFYNNVVYYIPKLQVDYFNEGIAKLKEFLSKTRENRKNKSLQYKEYLLDERFCPLIENYVSMYKSKLMDIDMIKDRLNGKVSDVEAVLELCFANNN